MARIALAGFLHETNTFVTRHTQLDAFVTADAWPGLVQGDAMLNAVAGANIASAGFIDAAQEKGHQLIPLLWASANPSGIVAQSAFDEICSMIENALRQAMPVDAVFLDLHGAMVTEQFSDGEGELLSRIRAIIGPDIPMVAALDYHANISQRMIRLCDAFAVYRTYPHVDMRTTGIRAAAIMQRLLNGEHFHKAFLQLPFLIPMVWQCTLSEPFSTLMQLLERVEYEHAVHAAIVPGFPLADVHDCGPSIIVYGAEASTADAAAHRLYDAVVAQRAAFNGQLYSAEHAVRHALRATDGPIILADTQDNPGGGSASDTTDILHELIKQRARSACVALLCDPRAAIAAHHAGLGAQIPLALGAGSGIGAAAVHGSFCVEALGDGKITGTGPFYFGCHMDLGLMARLRIDDVQILVSSRKQQAADRAMFHHLNIDPLAQHILVLKSSVHFRADFGAIAREVLIVEASGDNVADISKLHYQHLRAGVSNA